VNSSSNPFWRSPAWKWALFAILVAAAAALFWWPARAVKVELLPFTDSPPVWDGSYPYLVIPAVPESTPLKFHASIAMISPTVRHDKPVNEFDVDLHTGRFILRQTDLFVPDLMPLSLTRTYIVWDNHSRAFGIGGNHPYDICPTGTRFPYTYMNLNLEDWYQVYMPRISKGTGYADAVFRHSQTSSEFYGAMISWNGNGWTLKFADGRQIYFPEAYYSKTYAQGAPTAMDDGQGHRIELKRTQTRNLKELVSPGGHKIMFDYDFSDRIAEARDEDGHVRKYSYDRGGHVETVSSEAGVLYRFEYAPLMNDAGYDPWLLTTVFDGQGNPFLHNKYFLGRVSEQQFPDGQTLLYEYALQGRDVLQTTVTLPTGEKKIFPFRDGMLTEQK
jgi:YD repeat-containing protein